MFATGCYGPKTLLQTDALGFKIWEVDQLSASANFLQN